ncbi:TRAP transporter small permease [Desulfobacula sp.]|uniref:TRAP transporter small permease n=1 Tax=Desulfobacula sp. TaxID=2593537 RepID=UPI00260C1C17|nr:TRAP transporter small permease [Desulfobacula sp.]
MKGLKKMGKLFDHFLDLLMFLACMMLSVAMLLVCLDVFMRYLFNQPIIWAMDICEFMLVGIVSMGIGWLLKENFHVRMDFIVDRLNLKTRAAVELFASIVSVITVSIILYYGLIEIAELWQRKYAVETGILRVPKVTLLIPIAFGLILFVIQMLRQIGDHIKVLIKPFE